MASLSLTQVATAAAQFLGVLDSGEALSAQQITDALAAVNNLIDSYSIDRLMALSATVSTVATSTGVASYALPSRYTAIESASVLTPTPALPLKVCTAAEWAAIPDRSVSNSFIRYLLELLPDRQDVIALMQGVAMPTPTILAPLTHYLLDKSTDRPDLLVSIANSGITNAAALAAIIRLPGMPQGPVKAPDMLTILACLNSQPRFLFYDRGNPTGTIYLGGAPQTGTIQLVAWTAMSQFIDATTPLLMPPGFARMLELGAAVELAPQYDMDASAALVQDYSDAVARWRQTNASILGPEPAGNTVTPAKSDAPVMPGLGT